VARKSGVCESPYDLALGINMPQEGPKMNVQSNDLGGFATYENGNVSVGGYGGVTMGSGRAFGGAYITWSWTGCQSSGKK
jgi:hypothetical protein